MSERRRHWDGVYSRKADTEVSWFEAEPRVSLELVDSLGLAPGARVLDVGAGASRLVDGLLERALEVVVLDLSTQALAVSQARLGERASAVEWIDGDATAPQLREPVDLWHDRAVFHFLVDPLERDDYRAAVADTLKPGGHAIIATFAEDGPERCSGLPVRRYRPDELAAVLGPSFELRASRRHVHATPGGAEQRFQYSVLRLRGER